MYALKVKSVIPKGRKMPLSFGVRVEKSKLKEEREQLASNIQMQTWADEVEEVDSMVNQEKERYKLSKDHDLPLEIISGEVTEAKKYERPDFTALEKECGTIISGYYVLSTTKSTSSVKMFVDAKSHVSERHRELPVDTLIDNYLSMIMRYYKIDEKYSEDIYLTTLANHQTCLPNSNVFLVGCQKNEQQQYLISDLGTHSIIVQMLKYFNIPINHTKPINLSELLVHCLDRVIPSVQLVGFAKHWMETIVELMEFGNVFEDPLCLNFLSSSELHGYGGTDISGSSTVKGMDGIAVVMTLPSDPDVRVLHCPFFGNFVSFSLSVLPLISNKCTFLPEVVDDAIPTSIIYNSQDNSYKLQNIGLYVDFLDEAGVISIDHGIGYYIKKEVVSQLLRNNLKVKECAAIQPRDLYLPENLELKDMDSSVELIFVPENHSVSIKVNLNGVYHIDDEAYQVKFIVFHLTQGIERFRVISKNQPSYVLGVEIQNSIYPGLLDLSNCLAYNSFFEGMKHKFSIIMPDYVDDVKHSRAYMDVPFLKTVYKHLNVKRFKDIDFSYFSGLLFFLDSRIYFNYVPATFIAISHSLQASILCHSKSWSNVIKDDNKKIIHIQRSVQSIKKDKVWFPISQGCDFHTESSRVSISCFQCLEKAASHPSFFTSPVENKVGIIYQYNPNTIFEIDLRCFEGRHTCYECKNGYITPQIANICRRIHQYNQPRTEAESISFKPITSTRVPEINNELNQIINSFSNVSDIDRKLQIDVVDSLKRLLSELVITNARHGNDMRNKIVRLRKKVSDQISYIMSIPAINMIETIIVNTTFPKHLVSFNGQFGINVENCITKIIQHQSQQYRTIQPILPHSNFKMDTVLLNKLIQLETFGIYQPCPQHPKLTLSHGLKLYSKDSVQIACSRSKGVHIDQILGTLKNIFSRLASGGVLDVSSSKIFSRAEWIRLLNQNDKWVVSYMNTFLFDGNELNCTKCGKSLLILDLADSDTLISRLCQNCNFKTTGRLKYLEVKDINNVEISFSDDRVIVKKDSKAILSVERARSGVDFDITIQYIKKLKHLLNSRDDLDLVNELNFRSLVLEIIHKILSTVDIHNGYISYIKAIILLITDKLF